MKATRSALALLTLMLMACAPSGPGGPQAGGAPEVPPGSQPVAANEAEPSRPAPSRAEEALCAPLILDQDPGFGTHVVLRHLPNQKDLEELSFISGLRQVVVALPEWPASYDALRPLQQAILPMDTHLLVLLPGWPPSREALGAWDLLDVNLSVIVVVDGPPADRALITEMNRMRALERIIAQMEHPARSGFERLQRPLSFRVVR